MTSWQLGQWMLQGEIQAFALSPLRKRACSKLRYTRFEMLYPRFLIRRLINKNSFIQYARL